MGSESWYDKSDLNFNEQYVKKKHILKNVDKKM